MDYNTIKTNTYRDILKTDGSFDAKKVVIRAFLNSPDDFTKAEIKELAADVLNEALNNGMVNEVEDGIYESLFSHDIMHKM